MKAPGSSQLPSAPGSVDGPGGAARIGTYQGSLHDVDLSRLAWVKRRSFLARPLRRKRWVYGFLSTREVAVAVSVVDLGYAAHAFGVAVDFKDRRLLADFGVLAPSTASEVGDRPAEGLSASFRWPLTRVDFSRPELSDRYRMHARGWVRTPRVGRFGLDAELLAGGAAPAITVVAPVPDSGGVNVTQKAGGLLAFGTLHAGGRTYRLDGGVGGLDYTQGFPGRRTAWRWAFAQGRLEDGTPVGFNLVEGFNDAVPEANENALWLGDRLYPLVRARFSFDPQDPLERWRCRTEDGALEVVFSPLAVHRELRDAKVVKSRFVQPMGLFSGTLRVAERTLRLEAIPGVTEEQDVVW